MILYKVIKDGVNRKRFWL